ncbi:hypothetical protein BCR39DRAFT_518059 [Naematelia encephala]|uniref:DNA repair protein REV1 n=1 Tax=Naematelia encephala TaxID=71784 RepID=A0A1Y2BGR2_9TREE|nr:hypothetical protein BCR39DRAFT_518059 [Naematelia encephala]
MSQRLRGSQEEGISHSSSFPVSSPSFWDEAASVPLPSVPAKRRPSSQHVDDDDEAAEDLKVVPSDVDTSIKRQRRSSPETTLSYLPNRTAPIDIDDPHSYLVNPEYAPNKFGDIGDYMRKKEIKVQTQNRDIALASAAAGLPQIFAGLSFYINGNTHPPMEELRKMILQRGGEVRPVLRSKGMVKYIIAPMLTLSKFRQFANYKVVREAWILESCKEDKLLDWSRWKLQIQGGWEESGRKGLEGFLNGTQAESMNVKDEEEQEDEEKETVPPISLKPIRLSTRSLLTPVRPAFPTTSSSKKRYPSSPAPSTPKKEEPPKDIDTSKPIKQAAESSSSTVTEPGLAILKDSANSSIPISPSRVREETPAKEKIGPHIRKPEGGPWWWDNYYSRDSNEDAARLLKDQEWTIRNTAQRGNEGGFIDGYYQNSRLHHLSTWKAELKVLVAAAQRQSEEIALTVPSSSTVAPYSLSKSVLPRSLIVPPNNNASASERVIFHVDFDCFFVSCGLATRPHLRGKPAVVCHSQTGRAASSTSEIASASYEARALGVRNGMNLGKARTLVGEDLQTIPYEFETYKQFSLAFYTVLMGYADELQAVSVDEALIDVTSAVAARALAPEEAEDEAGEDEAGGVQKARDPAVEIAEKIRDDVRGLTQGCEVSIGISHNILLAKLATRQAKPAGVYHLVEEAVPSFLAPLDVEDFPSVGWSLKSKIQDKLGTTNCGELLEQPKASLQRICGPKNGEMIWGYLRGLDDRKLEPHKERKSVSAEMNYGIRFKTQEQAELCVRDLAVEVAKRMRQVNAKGKLLTLKLLKRHPDAPIEPPKFLGHGWCETFNKSASISNKGGSATDDPEILASESIKLLRAMRLDPVELRGVGIQITKLDGEAKVLEREAGQGTLSFARRPRTRSSSLREENESRRSTSPSGQQGLNVNAEGKTARSPTPALGLPVQDDAKTPPSPAAHPISRSTSPSANPPRVEPAKFIDAITGQSPEATRLFSANADAGPSRMMSTSSDGIDPDFLAALPPDLRLEVKRDFARTRAVSENPVIAEAVDPPETSKRAATISPAKPTTRHAAAHITRQLRPKVKTQLRASAIADLPLYGAWSKAKEQDHVVDLTAETDEMVAQYRVVELKELGIDPEVFRELPEEMQKEVFEEERRKSTKRRILHRPADNSRLRARERARESTRTASLSPSTSSRAGSAQPQVTRTPRIAITRPPKPTLLKVTRLPDVLETITKWIESRNGAGPAPRDAGKVRNYLLRCMDEKEAGIGGIEYAVEVLKWMRVLLREKWPDEEKDIRKDGGGGVKAGREWWETWKAFGDEVGEKWKVKFGASMRL